MEGLGANLKGFQGFVYADPETNPEGPKGCNELSLG